MELEGKNVVVTGGASGLGEVMTRRFQAAGANVVFCDLDEAAIERVAAATSTVGLRTDVTVEADIRLLAQAAIRQMGQIDLWVSNAGGSIARPLDATDAQWEAEWKLNVLSHVYAARTVLPAMLERGQGYLLQVASSVGLAIQPDAIGYSATKRAAVAVNEWLSLRYRRQGIHVSVFCPQGMTTPMLFAGLDAGQVASRMSLPEARSPEDAVDAVIEGLRMERFLILLQDRPLDEYRRKAVDYDLWMEDRIDEYLGVAAVIASERGDTA
jgi:NAD(P)-dependent dehydrogenase (short-subunit alcohol dehydrogenase family)